MLWVAAMPQDIAAMPQDQADALLAATETARRLGAGAVDPLVLHESEHISILLRPLGVVARLMRADALQADERLRRELQVAQHLVEKGAPVVAPVTALPAGPHVYGAFVLTLWRYVGHVAADSDNPEHMADAADALRRIHDALADFPGALPPLRLKIEKCRDLLRRSGALPALAATDRAFLLAAYDRIMAALAALPIEAVPIHGDAGAHNVFITADGACLNDFSDACMGPREWDIGWLPDIDLAPFEPVNRDVLAVLSDLRSLCVAVWCFDKYDVAEKREAADDHLGYLKGRF
jgi:hypothetical protein